MAIPVIYEDDHFIVINKNAGLLSIPDRFDALKENAYDLLSKHYESLYTVHRIDKDTSGLMIFAKDADSHKILNDAFEQHQIQKTYLALTESQPLEDLGRIELAIAHSISHPGKMVIHNKGKQSTTDFKVITRWKQFSLLELSPLTGRTHQIRIHLMHIGCPIICDPIYGIRNQLSIADIKRHSKLAKNDEQFRPLIERTALHAFGLKFNLFGKSHQFEIEPPKDFRACIQQLNKWQSI